MFNQSEKLKSILKDIGKAVVTLSGGVDSSYLACSAKEVLGENAYAVTFSSPLLPNRDRFETGRIAEFLKIPHEFIDIDELEEEHFSVNPKDKCYICKKIRLKAVSTWAKRRDIPWVLDGSNADDLNEYRPGMKAISEFYSVRCPFLEAEMSKNEIRNLAKKSGLSVWNKPAEACLASRISGEQSITKQNLRQVEEAEEFLCKLLQRAVLLRVRHHVHTARIEVEEDCFEKIIANSEKIKEHFKKIGFRFIALDLSGYQQGSMGD